MRRDRVGASSDFPLDKAASSWSGMKGLTTVNRWMICKKDCWILGTGGHSARRERRYGEEANAQQSALSMQL